MHTVLIKIKTAEIYQQAVSFICEQRALEEIWALKSQW